MSDGELGWSIAVDSIGSAGANMVQALGSLMPENESQLARLLLQAPSILLNDLTRDSANKANDVLRTSGLETRVLAPDEVIEPGGGEFEVALVIRKIDRMSEILTEIAQFVGVSPAQARSMVCASPAILIGQVSQATVDACRDRFAALGTEIDVTRPADALFDVFLGQCSPTEQARVRDALAEFGLKPQEGADQVVVQMGLSKSDADRLWEKFSRTSLPLRVISRDFQRFDITLDEAPDDPKFIAFLQENTGMPEDVAQRVIGRTPIVLHQLCGFDQMTEVISKISELGGKATGHLVLFQSFAIQISTTGDLERSIDLVSLLTECTAQEARDAIEQGRINGPLSEMQSRWLQYELAVAGTESDRVLL